MASLADFDERFTETEVDAPPQSARIGGWLSVAALIGSIVLVGVVAVVLAIPVLPMLRWVAGLLGLV